MDAEGDHDDVLMEGAVSISTALRSSLEVNEREQALSSEDLAWVDSCLVPDSEVPEGSSWDMVRDALLDVISSQPEGPPRSPSVILEHVERIDEANDECFGEEMEKNKDEIGDVTNEFCFENAFLPSYNEGARESGDFGKVDGLGLGFVLDENETEPSGGEIFKVWELESPTEEGDFVTQLNKALKSIESAPLVSVETPYETLPSSVEDVAMARSKGTKDESLDDLIASIADLSLSLSDG